MPVGLQAARLSLFIEKYLDRATRRTHQVVDLCCTMMSARCLVTHDHLERTAVYADGMAAVMGLDWRRRRELRLGALLHDIGKMGVPDSILHKPGKLTYDEFNQMKLHPGLGAEVLSEFNFGVPVHEPVRFHHERWNGGGYPDGLCGEEIPLTARILSVVDSYDAVREDRPYRKGVDRAEALKMLREGAGVYYDPVIVRSFIQNLHKFEREIERMSYALPQQRLVVSLNPRAQLAQPAAGLAAA
ncbi:MAG TPA: HD-GYP domain-containing protein [Pyrinomonadaceae bacterium]